MIIELTNDFHGTTARVQERAGKISRRAVRRAARELCGRAGCTCGTDEANTRGGAFFVEPVEPGGSTFYVIRRGD